MKTINLNGKMLLVPMSKIGEEVTTLIEQVDGMQNVLGADIFVYATGNMPERHCCCGGRGHHHDGGEGEHHCCGGHHHDGGEGEHHCCGGHHHEGEAYIDDDDLSDEDFAGEDEGEDLDTLLVVDEPLVMINTQQAHMLGIEVREDMFYQVPEEGLTLLPAASLDSEGFITTGPITIRMEE